MKPTKQTHNTKSGLARLSLPILGALVTSGCAGPPGGPLPPLLGPPFDQLASLILLGAVVLGAGYWIAKSARGPLRRWGDRLREPSAAEAILCERYARGEISRSQFGQMLDDLRKGLPPS